MEHAPLKEMPRCRRCGDVIGAYEPMVVLLDGHARATSRAADGDAASAGERYHDSCYAQLGERGGADTAAT